MGGGPGALLESHAFISYRSDDWNAAGTLTRLLQQRGLRAWWDRDSGDFDRGPRRWDDVRGRPILGGDDAVESELSSAIGYSIIVAVITSPHTLKSVWVRREIEVADGWQKPLFFWHVVDPEGAETVTVRRGGSPPGFEMPAGEWVETVAKHHEQDFLASPEAIEFTRDLRAQKKLNVIGHRILPMSGAEAVGSELNDLIELCELVLHRGAAINPESLQSFWPEYNRLCEEATKLHAVIRERFGRDVGVSRTPVASRFRLKRPFVLSRIRHLKRLLEDEGFRHTEFAKVTGR